jgi:hypothetical protein
MSAEASASIVICNEDGTVSDQPGADASTVVIVATVIAIRSDARWACNFSLARSCINSSINASRLRSSTASASNCRYLR